jgi:hypothetical protein
MAIKKISAFVKRVSKDASSVLEITLLSNIQEKQDLIASLIGLYWAERLKVYSGPETVPDTRGGNGSRLRSNLIVGGGLAIYM